MELCLDCSVALIEFEGRRCALTIASDHTAHKLAEEALRKAEKLQAAARMASTVAHEINNPFEAVTNCLYLARAEQERAHELLSTAERELGRMVHITKQTLAFYRDSGRPAAVDVCTLTDEVLELSRSALEAKKINVERQYDSAEKIMGYPDEIRLVVRNVIANAIEADGKSLRVRVSPGYDWAGSHRQGLRVTIADEGRGVPPEHRRRIFQPFFTTKDDKGTGLGLWVTRGIVQKLEGSIRLRSSTGPGDSGTCVSIFFPSAVTVEKQPSRAAAGTESAA